MRKLSLSNRSRSVLVACTLMTSALLGSNVARADTCRLWHLEVSGQFSNPIYDEDGNLINQGQSGVDPAAGQDPIYNLGGNLINQGQSGVDPAAGQDPIYNLSGNLIYQEATGSGYASHLGAISAFGMNYFSPPQNGIQVVDGDGIFTGVNGDQIFVNFDGTVLNLATGTGTGTYVVTGGTGRFEGATGSANFSASASTPNGGSAVEANGTLCF